MTDKTEVAIRAAFAALHGYDAPENIQPPFGRGSKLGQAVVVAEAVMTAIHAAPVAGGEPVASDLLDAIKRAEESAGTLSAKDAVKLVPKNWHAVCDLGRKTAAAVASLQARIVELEAQAALKDQSQGGSNDANS